jgi:hypothetical protein
MNRLHVTVHSLERVPAGPSFLHSAQIVERHIHHQPIDRRRVTGDHRIAASSAAFKHTATKNRTCEQLPIVFQSAVL